MHLTTRNVNTAFTTFVRGIHDKSIPTVRRPSRYGDTLTIEEPVTITYERPQERVLFNQARDCNPAFHLYEALWMLTGRNDIAPLAYYASRMLEFSDDGKTMNGAYGYRWRNGPCVVEGAGGKLDQLQLLIAHLKAKPESRRTVLTMWNCEDDLAKVDWSKDVCCNLNVMFSLRKVTGVPDIGDLTVGDRVYLDMTVTNRSNDMIWGLFGANYVHFTFLQEYMATHLGALVGKYHHFTNNLHVYTAQGRWEPEKWLKDEETETRYCQDPVYVSLTSDLQRFDKELPEFVEIFKNHKCLIRMDRAWREPFLNEVAKPLLLAFSLHKEKRTREAIESVSHPAWGCKAEDWRTTMMNWLKRRER
jgi:thymidylate synthase